MKIFFLCIAVLLALPVAAAAGADTFVCDFKEKFEDGGSRSVGLKLTVEGREVTGISYHNAVASGKEGGGYICAFDASASDGHSTWTRKGNRTVVELKGVRKSAFEISKSKKGFKILFLEMSFEYCGFGAEFPQYVQLDKGVKACRVKF
ncbi:MAG TPA: hypothetical protein P5551_06345 [Syntrophales bacterium]|jgi:hypothetical protein|nr:hypothetical protein [Syntrophales bacterium]HRT61963.1 hypothetical protein [Syntrophales bacterium]